MNKKSGKAFLESIINSIPSTLFLVNRDCEVQMLNHAAEEFAGGTDLTGQDTRMGAIFNCEDANTVPEGCGYSEACKECKLRNSIQSAFDSIEVIREKTEYHVQQNGKLKKYIMLISSRQMRFNNEIYVIVSLEDITSLEELIGLFPICASCKRVKKDKYYWEQVDTFLKTHSHMDFTNTLCEDCLERHISNTHRTK